MLLLRSLRARLLIIGIVPVLAALIVTAVMTVRSVNQFSDQQRYEVRTQQERDLKRLTTGLSREFAPLIGGLFIGEKNGVKGLLCASRTFDTTGGCLSVTGFELLKRMRAMQASPI